MIVTFLIVCASVLYCLPTIIALASGHPRIVSIGLLNILLGWSVPGWVMALVWAVSK
jgi:hypothetical protein